ncbi:MAG: redox-sensitive transcriptional activator SoxR [Acidobacteria bacterium]|nr:redox-sensitive transcriptional activator SoxR [Acidobacteriota bacterium]
MDARDLLTIGQIAARAGVATSTLRFYEDEGLVVPALRTDGNRRMYHREALRRIAFVRSAQRVGLGLAEIRAALAQLPDGRTPTVADWSRLSATWRSRLDAQIRLLESIRDDLDGCIGCGCLSLDRCRLYNPDDAAAARGSGARYLEGDTSADVLGANR